MTIKEKVVFGAGGNLHGWKGDNPGQFQTRMEIYCPQKHILVAIGLHGQVVKFTKKGKLCWELLIDYT